MASSLKARMQAGAPVVGAWLMLPAPGSAEIVAAAGYDTAMIDLEHGPGNFVAATDLIRAVEAAGGTAMMRVPANHPVAIKRALDTGISGVMVPSVENAAAAEAMVAACRYPPAGIRGMAAPVVRASGYGAHWQEYVRQADERLLRICQIETEGAVEEVESIAAVDGVDMLFVGPFDLSATLGYLGEPDHPEVAKVIARIEAAARKAGKLLGGITTPGRGVEDLLTAGYQMVVADSDVGLLRTAAEAQVERFRAAARRAAGGE